MLNSVRYSAFLRVALRLVWAHPLAAPTIIVACGPRRINDAMSTTYDTDMLTPLATGKWILNADVSDDSRTSSNSGRMGLKAARGTSSPNVTAPAMMTEIVYQRALGGSSR